ncbi:carbohydrate kinase, FGGY family protein [Pseudoflavonifractor capillosus ATCC 29799]|uniref:Carbohydrate kinase, FGGY family protein n=1 Tax=Pseudoflavonifractor capillosus ATCC 29799 TaxID=411467 RepID=A6NPU5_9FIRM|nr:rhamnulokinase family protein [Pseudoflavonifractor capillosus]EDN01870.1 carbohydrate kinase, FGGY family protein [Pseudoflavonifractor capillosus ATCC 29799]
MIHLAIDIGASSGRHIAAWREDGELKMKEVYRFSNLPDERDGHLVWDLDRLCREVVGGLKACKEQGIVPDSVGIDTWAVDYVLLDDQDRPILPLYCYRDSRGAEGAELAHKAVPFDRLYERTGIQFQPFNTIYQLCWDKAHGRLDNAADFLMLPEYLSFYLSGVKAHEYTNASSTGLLDAKGRTWDMEIVSALGLPERLFAARPQTPPVKLGRLKSDIGSQVGFDCDVVLPATHDTASAIAALPQKGTAYISSGTWSLLGAELAQPVTTPAAMKANFTNEGGVGTIRFLKNIMGLWLVQCLKRELNDQYSFAQLAQMAKDEANFDYQLDVNSARYLAPKSVIAEIDGECAQKGWPVSQTPGQYAHAIYQSLAHAYAAALDELESITGEKFDVLCIVGGGANNTYLNELTEQAIGRSVLTGSPEATALGNILLQEAAYV